MYSIFRSKRMMISLISINVLLYFVIFISIYPFSATSASASSGSEHSTIAGIQIKTDKRSEVEEVLLQQILKWKETPFVVETAQGNLEVDTSLFKFNVKETLDQFEDKTKNSWYQILSKKDRVDLPIQFTMNAGVIDALKGDPTIAVDETYEIMKKEIGNKLTSSIPAVQSGISLVKGERIALVVEEIEVKKAVLDPFFEQLNGLVIKPEEKVSYLDLVSSLNIENQEVSEFMASALYSLVLQSNYTILERHASPIRFKSFSPGTEAYVDRSQDKDLVFMNPNVVPGTFKFTLKDNLLTAELLSIPLDVTVELYQVEGEEIKPRTIYRYSEKLALGDEQVIEKGKPGVKVSTFRSITEKFGSFEVEELISKDYYPPTHRILLKSSLQPNTENSGLLGEGGGSDGSNPIHDKPLDKDSSKDKKPEKPKEVIRDKGGNIVVPSGK